MEFFLQNTSTCEDQFDFETLNTYSKPMTSYEAHTLLRFV